MKLFESLLPARIRGTNLPIKTEKAIVTGKILPVKSKPVIQLTPERRSALPIIIGKTYSALTAAGWDKKWVIKKTETWYKNTDVKQVLQEIMEFVDIDFIPAKRFLSNLDGIV